jgi:hypothetical protein
MTTNSECHHEMTPATMSLGELYEREWRRLHALILADIERLRRVRDHLSRV